jgi:hypothetical protein
VSPAGQRFDDYMAEKLADPAFRRGFERKLAEVKSIAQVTPDGQHRRAAPLVATREMDRHH